MGATSTIRTVETEHGPIEYDADMPMGALRALTGAAQSGDLGEVMAAMSKIITAWPFEGDPSDPSAWDGLRRSEFNTLTKKVMEDLGEQGNS
jgi:hypothetical protein